MYLSLARYPLEKVLCFSFNRVTEGNPSSPQESRLKFLANPNIKLAKFAGFCYGVKRAVDTKKAYHFSCIFRKTSFHHRRIAFVRCSALDIWGRMRG